VEVVYGKAIFDRKFGTTGLLDLWAGVAKLRKEGRMGLRLANAIRYLDCRAAPLGLAVFRA
jgi:hypothetical protein